MRTTRPIALLPLVAVLALPGVASANCYSVYDGQNRLAFQSTIAPVDLSARISDGVRARFPGGHLVMVPDDSDCREFRTGPTLSPRFDAGGSVGAQTSPEQMLQASPLLRGTGGSASDLSTREAVRTGNTLNLKHR